MTTSQQDQSDVKKAAEDVNTTELKDNLQAKKPVGFPESLTDEQETPFIDENVLTDD